MSNWIKVEDRLPEFGKPVIVVAKGFKEEGDYPLLMAKLIRITEDAEGHHIEWDDYQNIGLVDVSFWQPLPEPPTE